MENRKLKVQPQSTLSRAASEQTFAANSVDSRGFPSANFVLFVCGTFLEALQIGFKTFLKQNKLLFGSAFFLGSGPFLAKPITSLIINETITINHRSKVCIVMIIHFWWKIVLVMVRTAVRMIQSTHTRRAAWRKRKYVAKENIHKFKRFWEKLASLKCNSLEIRCLNHGWLRLARRL